MSTFDCSDMVLLACKLQLNKEISPYLSLKDFCNVRVTASVCRNSSDLKELIVKLGVEYLVERMFAGLYDNYIRFIDMRNNEAVFIGSIFGINGVGVTRSTAAVVQIGEHSFFGTLAENPDESSPRILEMSLIKESNVIRIHSYDHHYCQEVRVSALSDQECYRGDIIAVDFSKEVGYITHFEVDRSSPFDLHKIAMKRLSTTGDSGDSDDD